MDTFNWTIFAFSGPELVCDRGLFSEKRVNQQPLNKGQMPGPKVSWASDFSCHSHRSSSVIYSLTSSSVTDLVQYLHQLRASNSVCYAVGLIPAWPPTMCCFLCCCSLVLVPDRSTLLVEHTYKLAHEPLGEVCEPTSREAVTTLIGS